MFNDRLDELGDYPFRRLTALLAGLETPPGAPVLSVAVGEPQFAPPALIAATLAANERGWGRYPPVSGTPDWRAAVADWLTRRYRLPPGFIDADRAIAPASGTREALFQTALAVVPTARAGARAKVGMPNPFYQVYRGAAVLSGAEAVLLPCRADGLPELDALTPALLAETALIYLCTPSNPQGAVAPLDYLMKLIALCRARDVVLAADECYAEIYDVAPPPGALEACAAMGGGCDNVVVFHSLSKRSSAPGLRSGFVAGDPRVIGALLKVMDFGAAGIPLPIMAASAALWRDETHVEPIRAAYRANFQAAERVLGNRLAARRPAGGFFLWLDVGDGETAARRLWTEVGVRSLPGAYLASPNADGINPGARFLRVALVHEPETTATILERMAKVL